MSTGRRPGPTRTRESILTAARHAFAERGYSATSVRSVARAAAVDPALVLHFFGSKDGLFEAALELPIDPAAVVSALLADGVDGLGERLLRAFLEIWDGAASHEPMVALLRGAVSHEESAALLREVLTQRLLRPLVDGAGADQPQLRSALVASQLVGVALTRYVLRLPPLATASADRLAPVLGATLQRYLTEPLRPRVKTRLSSQPHGIGE